MKSVPFVIKSAVNSDIENKLQSIEAVINNLFLFEAAFTLILKSYKIFI